jgi:3-methylcrotonyl-CoA carboxylase alpha subunit
MFSTILVANRGEIACRILRTARRMGIRSVAVYSSADEGARHVRMADAALCIGPPSPRESYLHGDRILAAAAAFGAQAIHPGYGFLSESAHFAQACAQAGVCFIGPPPQAIRAMGSKSAAKALLQSAGVPLTPGYHGENQDPVFLAAEAARIGFPVLIKASAGGGGKGMRRVDRTQDFAAALAACQRESQAAFGSDQVLIEKYILQPRHIEMQVFADTHGNVVHLFERDCSVQRRHQKVIEEAPAPGMTAARRAAMGRAATQVARAVGYVGAGTVEFIVPRAPEGAADAAGGEDGAFFFMEMNTRLQVEHPVTEMITGLDLVEWQLRVAAGEPLPATQEQIAPRGHAIEARIYAEDADRGFIPGTGTIAFLAAPAPSEHVRLDAGVEAGDTIGPHYDPMIAKLIAWDVDREAARARLRAALAQTHIVGVVDNLAFLGRLVDAPSFAAARLDTDLIERDAAFLAAPDRAPPRNAWLVAALAQLEREARLDARAGRAGTAWGRRDGWRANLPAERVLNLRWHGPGRAGKRGIEERRCEERRVGAAWHAGGRTLTLDRQAASCRAQLDGTHEDHGRLQAQIDDQAFGATVVFHAGRWHVFGDCTADPGGRHEHAVFELHDPLADAAHRGGAGVEAHAGVLAPMPGRVIAVLVEEGSRVERDTPLLIVEAMKMEHTVRAPAAGVVRAARVAVGDAVAMQEPLLDFDPDPPEAAGGAQG